MNARVLPMSTSEGKKKKPPVRRHPKELQRHHSIGQTSGRRNVTATPALLPMAERIHKEERRT